LQFEKSTFNTGVRDHGIAYQAMQQQAASPRLKHLTEVAAM
jgi:hypothetical protein